MKFSMGAGTLQQLTARTSSATDDLGALVRQLKTDAEPLDGQFNGEARRVFDEFKLSADGIAADLNNALNSVLAGVSGMDTAFVQGEQEMSDQGAQIANSAIGGHSPWASRA